MAVRYLNATGTQYLIDEIKRRLSLKADSATVSQLASRVESVVSDIPTKTSQLTNDSDFETRTHADETFATKESLSTLASTVQQNQSAIAVLNADDRTEGSVDFKIAQAMEGGDSLPCYAVRLNFAGSTDISPFLPPWEELPDEFFLIPYSQFEYILNESDAVARDEFSACWRNPIFVWRNTASTTRAYEVSILQQPVDSLRLGGAPAGEVTVAMVLSKDAEGIRLTCSRTWTRSIAEQEIRSLFV